MSAGPARLCELALVGTTPGAALEKLAVEWKAERVEAEVTARAVRLLAGTLSTYAPHNVRHPDNLVDEYMDLARAQVMAEMASNEPGEA